jgi:hypothetical protein
MLALATAALLVPGLGLAAGQPAMAGRYPAVREPERAAGAVQKTAAAAPAGCVGIYALQVPPGGAISDVPGTGGGTAYWAPRPGGAVCVGHVRMWVYYPSRQGVLWLVMVQVTRPGYRHSAVVGQQEFDLPRGWYYWDFPVHGVFQPGSQGGVTVCLTTASPAAPAQPTDLTCAPLP